MAVLGVILAGGKSQRFGSDKALARVDGKALIEHAVLALSPQVNALAISGRPWGAVPVIEDYPAPGLGPLGGLAGALRYAGARGFDHVLSVPVDTYPLPRDLTARLGAAPAVFADQYLIGIWPADLAAQLEEHIAEGHRSVRSWIEASGCRMVEESGLTLRNINRPADLA